MLLYVFIDKNHTKKYPSKYMLLMRKLTYVFFCSTHRKMGWRLGLQAVTGLVSFSFFMGLLYRPASLYHPQRRAILHLKNQRKKVIYRLHEVNVFLLVYSR